MRVSRLQRPPSLEPALSRSSLQTASAVTTTFSRKGFYRLSAGSFSKKRQCWPTIVVFRGQAVFLR